MHNACGRAPASAAGFALLVTPLLCYMGALSYRMMFIDKMFRTVRTGK